MLPFFGYGVLLYQSVKIVNRTFLNVLRVENSGTPLPLLDIGDQALQACVLIRGQGSLSDRS